MKKEFLIVFAILILSQLTLFSQTRDRSYIREQISYHGECRNVAITKHNGDIMLYGSNGWAASGCPKGLTDALSQLNDDGEYINDVQLTEDGRWLILYGNNGFRWNDIPYSLERKIREYNSNGEKITSVSFNDAGDWIVVSTEHYSASDSNVLEWMKEGNDKYGQIWTTCVTDEVVIVVYEDGFSFVGDIPESLKRKLDSTYIDVYRLKVAGTAWFFSDGKSRYEYSM